MDNQLCKFLVPIGSLIVAISLSHFSGSAESLNPLRSPQEQTPPPPPIRVKKTTLKLSKDTLDDLGSARATALIKPLGSGTITGFRVISAIRYVRAPGGSYTSAAIDPGEYDLRVEGIGDNLAAAGIDMLSSWRTLFAASLPVDAVELSWSIEVEWSFSDGTTKVDTKSAIIKID